MGSSDPRPAAVNRYNVYGVTEGFYSGATIITRELISRDITQVQVFGGGKTL
jgi:hypothetical protein